MIDDRAVDSLLAPYRKAVEEGLRQVKEKNSTLSEVAYEYVVGGGKMLRPSIVLLACEAVSESYEKAMPIALAYELAHTASLTQDDIIDESPTRHNRPTAHTKYSVTTAILISDMLIFEIFEQLSRYALVDLSPKRVAVLIGHVANAAKEAAEGEFLEMQLSKKREPTVEDYLKLAGLKTGALFGAAAASGGIVGGAKQGVVADLYEYGRNLGISFQMMDDVLDITGTTEKMGKPMLMDMQNNAGNIVLIHAMTSADPQKRNEIRGLMARSEYGLADALEVQGILDDLGSVEFASESCLKHASIARERLKSLPDTRAKQILEELTRWLEGRRR
ncbi:MAG: polyprenyl synthetase family protein [Nitrososphaerales archaeon]